MKLHRFSMDGGRRESFELFKGVNYRSGVLALAATPFVSPSLR